MVRSPKSAKFPVVAKVANRISFEVPVLGFDPPANIARVFDAPPPKP